MSLMMALIGKRKLQYGYFYNWFAVDNANGLAPTGWRIPTIAEFRALRDYVDPDADGDDNIAGGKLKSRRTDPNPSPRWLGLNVGATNEYGFSFLPSGGRIPSGSSYGFFNREFIGSLWSSTENTSFDSNAVLVYSSQANLYTNGSSPKKVGFEVRCIQNKDTGESDGDEGTLTDASGNIYKWVVIGANRWMTESLRTTKYANGTNIPNVTDATDWSNLTTGAYCIYQT